MYEYRSAITCDCVCNCIGVYTYVFGKVCVRVYMCVFNDFCLFVPVLNACALSVLVCISVLFVCVYVCFFSTVYLCMCP